MKAVFINLWGTFLVSFHINSIFAGFVAASSPLPVVLSLWLSVETFTFSSLAFRALTSLPSILHGLSSYISVFKDGLIYFCFRRTFSCFRLLKLVNLGIILLNNAAIPLNIALFWPARLKSSREEVCKFNLRYFNMSDCEVQVQRWISNRGTLASTHRRELGVTLPLEVIETASWYGTLWLVRD